MVRNVIQNKVTHVALIIDESLSMSHHRDELIKVVDGQVQYLARRSQELDQETRVSIYTFSNEVRCLVYEKDVLRLPSIANLYRPDGMTALIDATLQALDDLSKTPELYGEHAFLAFALTDGQENRSRNKAYHLSDALQKLPNHWTVGVLVPDMMGKHDAQQHGFPPGNIAIWDADTAAGVQEAGQVIQQATENFMTGRSRGVRGTKNLFALDTGQINKKTVASNLTALTEWQYDLIPVTVDSPIAKYIESKGTAYNVSKCYYQLTKPEKVQEGKEIALRERKDPNRRGLDKVYVGSEARKMLGLPDYEVKVQPDQIDGWDIFIQSTSYNRKLIAGTDVLVLR